MKKRKKIVKWIVRIIVSVMILLLTLGSIFTFRVNKMIFGNRTEYDENITEVFITFDEITTMDREQISFLSKDDVKLVGYFYTSKDESLKGSEKSTIVFSHGIGATHDAYLLQIEYFVKNGYKVFAYDNTGCGASGGENIGGLGQSVADLDHALKYLETLSGYDSIFLYGHSWGGFAVSSVMNNDYKQVKAIVSRSGFNSANGIYRTQGRVLAGPFINIFTPFNRVYNQAKFGKYASYTGVGGLNNTSAPVLVLQSRDDVIVPLSASVAGNEDKITNPNVEVIIYEDRGHDLVLSYDAIKYKTEYEAKIASAVATSEEKEDLDKIASDVKNYHYDKVVATQLDEEIMKLILDFFEENI